MKKNFSNHFKSRTCPTCTAVVLDFEIVRLFPSGCDFRQMTSMEILIAAEKGLKALHDSNAQHMTATEFVNLFEAHTEFKEVIERIAAQFQTIQDVIGKQRKEVGKLLREKTKLSNKMIGMHKKFIDLKKKASKRVGVQMKKIKELKKEIRQNIRK